MPALLAAAAGSTSALADVALDFNSDNSSFASSFNTASFEGPWSYNATGGVGGSGGWTTIGQAANIGHSCTTDLTSSPFVVGANGNVSLSFDHRYSFEVDSGGAWDGGAVFVSVNGGAYSMVSNSAFSVNGYNGTVAGWGAGSELAGAGAVFMGTSSGYGAGTFLTSVANLGDFVAGDTLSVRFRAAFDSNTSAGSPAWAIDNVTMANIVPAPGPLALLVAAGLVGARRRRT